MNTLPLNGNGNGAPPDDPDNVGFDPVAFVDFLIDERWLILAVAAGTTFIGALNATLQTPVYQAFTLIQIEGRARSGLEGVVGQAAGVLDSGSSLGAEAEILKSRLVVGRAVADLQLNVHAEPRRPAVVGNWLSRRANGLSEPGFLGDAGLVTGQESIEIALFQVPPEWVNQTFTVRATTEGFEVKAPDGLKVGSGVIGERTMLVWQGAEGALIVRKLHGKPGAEFTLRSSSALKVTQGLQGRVGVEEQGRGTGIMRVTFRDTNPARAAQVLNAIGEAAVRQNIERRSAEAEKSLVFLDSLLPQLRKQLDESEQRFDRFRNERGLFTLDSEAQVILGDTARARVQIYGLEQQKRQLLTRLQPRHPSIIAIDQQIAAFQKELADAEMQIQTLPDLERDLLRLNREVLINQQLYTGLLNTVQQLQLAKEGNVGNVRIIDNAVPPDFAVEPQRTRILTIALLVGLLAGMLLAYLRRRLRQGMVSPDEIEERTGLNVFATVPLSSEQAALDAKSAAREKGLWLLAATNPQDVAVESLRSLRTTLQFAMQDAPNNLVLITGPTPGLGKSFTAANFAHVLAAGGKRVLLVDADFRKGYLHRIFGREAGHGFSELITGASTPEQVIAKGVAPNLDLLTTGVRPPNPAELLLSPKVAPLLESLRAQYDIVILDSPPVLAVSDTQTLGPLSGTVFLVTRAEITTPGEVQESLKRLRQAGASVRGAIFNGIDLTRKRYGYGYGYGYRYGYRYGGYRYRDYRYTSD